MFYASVKTCSTHNLSLHMVSLHRPELNITKSVWEYHEETESCEKPCLTFKYDKWTFKGKGHMTRFSQFVSTDKNKLNTYFWKAVYLATRLHTYLKHTASTVNKLGRYQL